MARNLALSAAVFAVTLGRAAADGGVPLASAARDDLRVTLFVAPANPVAGPVDVSVLVQDLTTEAARTDLPVWVEARFSGDEPLTINAEATSEAATNRLLRAATLDLSRPGRWTLTATVRDVVVRAAIEVGPAPLAWSDLWLWIGWPFAAVALFGVHRWRVHAVQRRASRRPTSCRVIDERLRGG
jgi:hypothetical protein